MEIKDFIDKVYHQPQPSRYLATFAKFTGEHQSNPFIKELVKGCFKAFIEAFILRYEDCKSLKVSFIGSVAFHFQDILKGSLAYYGLTLGEIMQAPVEGLINYYGGKV